MVCGGDVGGGGVFPARTHPDAPEGACYYLCARHMDADERAAPDPPHPVPLLDGGGLASAGPPPAAARCAGPAASAESCAFLHVLGGTGGHDACLTPVQPSGPALRPGRPLGRLDAAPAADWAAASAGIQEDGNRRDAPRA